MNNSHNEKRRQESDDWLDSVKYRILDEAENGSGLPMFGIYKKYGTSKKPFNRALSRWNIDAERFKKAIQERNKKYNKPGSIKTTDAEIIALKDEIVNRLTADYPCRLIDIIEDLQVTGVRLNRVLAGEGVDISWLSAAGKLKRMKIYYAGIKPPAYVSMSVKADKPVNNLLRSKWI